MGKTKDKQALRIIELERKLQEAEASQVHLYHFGNSVLDKLSTERLMGSGVILTLTLLGGHKIITPTMIRNGLSKETIAALKADFVRSYEYAIELKPNK